MKTILIILDGVSEEKVPELNNMTPLEYAKTPTLNKIIKKGSHSKTTFCPTSRNPDSLNCILTILGVAESCIPKNRAYLEAIASDINIEDDEVVLRCNLISVKDNKLETFYGKGLSIDELESVSHNVKTGNNLKFYHISEYRNIIVVKKDKDIVSLKDVPPHENMGQSMETMINDIRKIEKLNEFVQKNQIVIKSNDYMFYPWGVSEKIKLPVFSSLHNKSCSCVCNAEIVKGIAKAMKIDVVDLKNSTGDTNTDLYEKANAVIGEIKTHDIVIAHINGTDEVSHRKDLWGKIQFIEKIDREFLNPIYKNTQEKINLIIVSDHQTSSKTGKHEKGCVDIIMSIKESERNDC
ncbi:hypothetical protein [Sedimentibacter sp. MB31-C6]|uniref:hypothetical protein n=1 Tax=Sedimentibacter sp. MB31-C6 TaxID=3109366 RepID=UPI002DDD4BA5|nr:hypothetical protein [Sedimentibacter sp. MB36-C1]WSI04517.1 hypothetical protein U8307_01680 [Sedimentibacter sp. MB36-C1]